jgi:uncharacterized Zn finger protein (UPF0148 family)
MKDNSIDPHPEVIGKTFGKITVVEFKGFKKKRLGTFPYYVTRCICNNCRDVMFSELYKRGKEFCPYCRTIKAKREKALHDRSKGIVEHLRQKAEVKKKAQAVVAKKYKIDLEHVTRMLLNDREYARTGKLLYEDDRAEEAPPDKAKLDPRAAVQATHDLAVLHGLMVKRTEVTIVDSVEKMRDDELVDFIEKLGEKLESYKTIEARPRADLPLIEQPEPEIIGYEDED